jgi:hypothetical protein
MVNEALTLRKQREYLESAGSWCPCGEVQIAYEYRHSHKYCSSACRKKYAKPSKVKDPTKQVTFNCETCEKEVTRYYRYGGSLVQRFCSNECAAKFNRAIQHIGVNGVILDSGWEALFWGLCKFLKVPIERLDRAQAIEWAPGCWYAPDFLMGRTYVEIKGMEDSDDQKKWDAWNNQVGRLLVLDKALMDKFRKMSQNELMAYSGIASVIKS